MCIMLIYKTAMLIGKSRYHYQFIPEKTLQESEKKRTTKEIV